LNHFFQNFPNFTLGLGVSIEAMVTLHLLRFYQAQLHSPCVLLSWCYRWRINKVSNIKIRRHTCSHCLFHIVDNHSLASSKV